MSALCWPWPVGIIEACLDTVLPYMHERRQFDAPIGTFQLVQGKLADIYTRLSASRRYVYAVTKPATVARQRARMRLPRYYSPPKTQRNARSMRYSLWAAQAM